MSPERALSPITELTTPASLATPLPLTDYDPKGGGHADDERSTYSNDSADTVTEARHPASAPGPSVRSASLVPSPGRHTLSSVPMAVPQPPPRSLSRPAPPAISGNTHPISTSPTQSPLTACPSSPTPIQFPAHQAPSPGGLLPPPRSTCSANNPKLVKRVTPPPCPSAFGLSSDEARRRYADRYWPKTPEEKMQEEKEAKEREYEEEKGRPNMAGVGAGGRSRPGSLKSRPNSFHARSPLPSPKVDSPVKSPSDLDLPGTSVRPALTLQPSHPTLHNIPLFAEPIDIDSKLSPKKESPPSRHPASRSNSLKKPRPHSDHASGPTVARWRPSSFSGSPSKSSTRLGMVSPMVGLDAVTIPRQAVEEVSDTVQDTTFFSPSDNPCLTLGPQQADISRSSSHHIASNEPQNPARRTRVSSILSSIFGGERSDREPKATSTASRKLSKRSRRTSGSTGGSPAQSPETGSPLLMDESVLPAERPAPPVHAIRTSGIFGIRDDGSEVFAHVPWQGQGHGHAHTGSHGASSASGGSQSVGSPHTQTDGVRRTLYVENQGVAIADERPELNKAEVEREGVEVGVREGERVRLEDENESEAIAEWEAYHSSMDAGSPISQSMQSAQGQGLGDGDAGGESGQEGRQQQVQAVQSLPAVMVTSSNTTPTPSMRAHAELQQARQSPSDSYELGSFSPRQPMPTTPSPTATEAHLSSGTHLPLTTPPKQVDDDSNKSAMSSPARSLRSPRPLPHPPSRRPYPYIDTPQPTFIPPPPPSTSPAVDLPILIASYLLSTHAAALFRHSSEMKDVSEAMHNMAKESLDWGGILMGMADKMRKPGSTPTPASASGMGLSMDGLPRIREDAPTGAEYDGVPLPRTEALALESMARAHHTSGVSQQPSAYPQLPPQWPNAYDPIQAAYNDLTARPIHAHPNGDEEAGTRPRGSSRKGTPPLQVLRGDECKRQADSLPADLFKKAQRLGKEGWQSVHAAEEAWAMAMSVLAELVERGELGRAGGVGVGRGGGDRGKEGSGETGAGWSGEATVGPSVVYPDPRDPRFTLSPDTVLSYPLGSGAHLPLPSPLLAGGGVDPNKSFIDTCSPQSSGTFPHTRTFPHAQAMDEDSNATISMVHRSRPSFSAVSGHAFSNPLIQPQPAAPSPARARSASAQPVSPMHRRYTDDQLGPSIVFPSPLGAVTPVSTPGPISPPAEGRSRLGSTMTATSAGTWMGTVGGTNTLKGRKLVKKTGQGKGQGQGQGQESAGSTTGKGTVKSTSWGTGGRRHWWSRRRSEAEGVSRLL